MHKAGVPRRVVRYVDDFIVIAPTAAECQDSLDTMLATCLSSGFSVQPSKVTTPATIVEFLGIVIDSEWRQLRISAERLRDLSTELHTWLGIKRASKRQLLSLVSKLAFASKVVHTGRAFLGRLLAAAKTAKELHHLVKLNADTRADLKINATILRDIWWPKFHNHRASFWQWQQTWMHHAILGIIIWDYKLARFVCNNWLKKSVLKLLINEKINIVNIEYIQCISLLDISYFILLWAVQR